MVLAKYGENTEIDENAAGDTVIRNTATGTEVLLSDFVDIVGGVGSSSNRVGGTSFFDGLDANSVNTDTTQTTSLGHDIEDLTNETANRSAGTVYQNTSNFNLFVTSQITNATEADAGINAVLQSSSSSTPNVTWDSAQLSIRDGDEVALQCVVAPSNYYRIQFFGSGSIDSWQEGLYQ